jgi:hypothetical protein
MRLDENPTMVDVSLQIPTQPGLPFSVGLNLQADELHLNAGAFWVEWFPCTTAERAQDFQSCVCGLLSGQYRIVETYRGLKAVKAELQRPSRNTWETIATWRKLSLPWPRKVLRVLGHVPVA